MIQRALAFGMTVVGWDKVLDTKMAEELGITHCATALDVARQADVISVHVASTPQTAGLVGVEFLAAMKPGAMLVNASRSAVVDDEALLAAMDDKGIRVATDVPPGEPAVKQGEFSHRIAAHPGAYITHHIGASTAQATAEIGAEAARVVRTYAETGEVANCVNIETHSPATHLLTVRHLDRVGVLARVLDAMRQANWNVQEMENLVFAGAEAACARIRFDGYKTDSALAAIMAQDEVIAASLIEL